MAEVVSLHGPACDDLVAMLERLLQEARDGEIIGFAYALEKPYGVTASGWERTPAGNGNAMMGAISFLQHRFAASMVEGD